MQALLAVRKGKGQRESARDAAHTTTASRGTNAGAQQKGVTSAAVSSAAVIISGNSHH